MRSFILKISNSREKRTEKARPACDPVMEANRRREGGVEMRRLHIVYFLSRNGKTEQPHLIRVHHLSNNGVHLRDVKRWLSELRGTEMPDSFSWSYKRSYKNGHIWQDLTDNDLITPFSDNEYILKGSLIPSLHNKAVEQFFPFHERKTAAKKQDTEEEEDDEEEEIVEDQILKTPHETLNIEANSSPKPPPRGDEESPTRPPTASSSSSDQQSAPRNKTVVKSERREGMKEGDKEKSCNKVVALKKNGSQVDRSNSKGRGEAQPRRGAAYVLRNLLRCRLVDTKDTVKRESRGMNGSLSRKSYQTSNSSNERKNWEQRGSNGRSRKMTEKNTSATYKPSKEPNCSQCGKPFKPEKLHSHMKSCIALNERGRSSSLNKEKQTGTKRPSKVTVTVL